MEQYIDFRKVINYDCLQRPVDCIRNGGLVLFPTETVYGIGANGLNENAVKKIYIAKGRKQDNPLILHISDINMLNLIAKDITDIEYKLMNQFWPGPFTIILNRTKIVPNVVTGGLDTVGIRMPSGKIARKLIELSGVPIAAPSANVSGKPSGTNVNDIFDELSNKVDYIIDGGECDVGVESTIVRVINDIPNILRPGAITPEQIKKVAGDVKIDKHILQNVQDENEIKNVLSPGMKYSHYAPNSKCMLVYSKDNDKLVNKIKQISKDYSNPLILTTAENEKKYEKINLINIGSRKRLDEIAKNIFSTLRKVDKLSPDIVIIEGVESKGIGLAIMNRLIRSCNYNFIEIE